MAFDVSYRCIEYLGSTLTTLIIPTKVGDILFPLRIGYLPIFIGIKVGVEP